MDPSPPKNPSLRRQTALAAVQGFNDWTIEAILAPRAPDCTHHVLPATIGRPPMTNEQFQGLLVMMIPKFKRFTVTIRDLIEDSESNKVVIWATSAGETVSGEPYGNEYMLMLHFNETGDKVTRFMEFVDSAYTLGLLPKSSDKPEAAQK